ncbi:helix-turn-helix transcriptional regulator [Niabella ginsenosidivorans]|nr:helix-turn-helix transcriptional regulator [Niabella ginsenosidivorans]
MTNTDAMQKKIHQGHNIKRFREMLGIKQDALAADLGDDWNQQKISLLEQKETIDAPLLQQVAEALKLPVEAIKNFDEDQAINIISNTVNNNDNANGNTLFSYYPTINPIEKWLEALEENKKLYERMIKEKDDMIYTLQAMLENMKK